MKAEIELEKKKAQKALERTKFHYDENRDKQAKENIISYLQSPDNWEDGNAVLISVLTLLRDTPVGVTKDEVDEEHLDILATRAFLQEIIDKISNANDELLIEKTHKGVVYYLTSLKEKVDNRERRSAIIERLKVCIGWFSG